MRDDKLDRKVAMRLDKKTYINLLKIVRAMNATSRYQIQHSMSDAVRYAITLASAMLTQPSTVATPSTPEEPSEDES